MGGSRGRGRGRGRGLVLNPAMVAGRGISTSAVAVAAPITVKDTFIQATSSNLPKMSFLKVADYFRNLRSPELRQAKDSVSSGAVYGDSAIGYVKIKKENAICNVVAKVTPQTSVNNTPYNVQCNIAESDQSVLSASCNCQASSGHCKHQTALIFWLLRRHEEPAPTDVLCYWKKSILSTVKNIKAKSIDELSSRNTDTVGDDSVLNAFIAYAKDSNKEAGVVRYSQYMKEDALYMDHLVISYMDKNLTLTCDSFIKFCSTQMTEDRCKQVFEDTKSQSNKAEWYHQRFGRITASKLFECSNCKTTDGVLVSAIMGARGFKGNRATERGLKLEEEIFEQMKKKYPTIQKCGIVLRGDLPMFGASPDGINEEFVFEIKCPSKAKTVKNYIDNGVVADKVYYQMQLQMLMAKRSKAILCVADPNYEKNKIVTRSIVSFDEKKIKQRVLKCKQFWTNVVFPRLK